MGVQFNGTSQYLSVADEAFFDWDRNVPFSAAAWIYRPLGSQGPILSKADSGSGTGVGWALNADTIEIHLTNDNVANNEIRAFGPDPYNNDGGLFPCAWQHVGFSYTGSSTLAGCKLYVAGRAVTMCAGSLTCEDTLSASILVNTPVRSGFIPPSEFWPGAIADIVVCDYVMTATDFANLANLAKLGVPRTTMLSAAPKLWLPLQTVSQTSDLSGNGKDATLTGSPTTLAGPSVSWDSWSNPATFTTTQSWTHTPIGTPRGVVVMIVQNASAADRISSVTYGGVAMTRVQFAVDSATELGASYLYFLGKGIPTGAQTVTVTVSTGTETKKGISISVVAPRDTRVAASGKVEGNAANPSVTLATTAGYEGMCFAALFSGHDDVGASVTEPSGYQALPKTDFGATGAVMEYGQRQGANVACGFTAATDDVALVAAAIETIPERTGRRFVRSDAVHRASRW